MHEDFFIVEFFNVLEVRISEWIKRIGHYAWIGDVDMSSALEGYINYLHYPMRAKYCYLRHSGVSVAEAIESVVKLPLPTLNDRIGMEHSFNKLSFLHRWVDILSQYKGLPVYYANIRRMAEYITPFLFKEKSEAVLVTDGDICAESLSLPGNLTVLRFPNLHMRLFRNDFIERYFPDFFTYANTISFLDYILSPPVFHCVCGCQTQSKMWASICNTRGAISMVFQHGWPAFMHAGFSNLPYRYMALWGKGFKKLWQEGNCGMKFKICGYPYPIAKNGYHDRITFFLQEPYFVTSQYILNQFYSQIVNTAINNPDRIIQYRVHPESKIERDVKKKFDILPNVEDVSEQPLAEVYSSSKVVISHYSSSLMECIVHGCCPMAYNLTPNWTYLPDLESEGVGFVSTSPLSFDDKLAKAMAYCICPEKIAEWYEAFSPLSAT